LEPILRPRVESPAQDYLDYGLHLRPAEMRPALQARLDALPEPSTVIVGYGLCGNGVVGVGSGRHTLILPRTHDCIALMLGSQERYAEELATEPGTYYVTRGWLTSGDDPLTAYRKLVEDHGAKLAGRLIDRVYGSYRKLRLLGFSEHELEETRPAAAPVAGFCMERWGMTYDECIGDPGLVERLAAAVGPGESDDPDLLVVPPGTTITQQMFLDET
jgi:hypothetical protein